MAVLYIQFRIMKKERQAMRFNVMTSVIFGLIAIGMMGLCISCDSSYYSVTLDSFMAPDFYVNRSILSVPILDSIYAGDIESAIVLLESTIDSTVIVLWEYLQEEMPKERQDDLINELREIRAFRATYPVPMLESSPHGRKQSKEEISRRVADILEQIDATE